MIVKTDNQYYSDIASAIREKNETSTKYKPSEMAIAIENIESGGIQCTLSISTTPNATVTATLDGTTVSAKANVSGIATLKLPKEGVWTVTATADGNSVSIQVNTAFSITTELTFLPPVDPVFANNSWEVISQISKSGQAKNFWSIGDEKTARASGEGIYGYIEFDEVFQIIGFDHDDVANPSSYGRNKAGITLLQKYGIHNIQWSDSESDTWANSTIRTLCNDFLEGVTEVFPYVVPVIKLAAKSANANETQTENVTDLAFLLSANEVFETVAFFPKVNEGTQYEYFAAGNSIHKEFNPIYEMAGFIIVWWTRSMYSESGSSASCIDRPMVTNPSYSSDVKGGRYSSYGALVYAFCL